MPNWIHIVWVHCCVFFWDRLMMWHLMTTWTGSCFPGVLAELWGLDGRIWNRLTLKWTEMYLWLGTYVGCEKVVRKSKSAYSVIHFPVILPCTNQYQYIYWYIYIYIYILYQYYIYILYIYKIYSINSSKWNGTKTWTQGLAFFAHC